MTYGTLLLREYHVEYWSYAFALINALVIAKVIMIGEYAKLGKYESRPLFLSAIWKQLIKHLVHGEKLPGTFNEMRIDELLGRARVVFCTFIPLFGFRGISPDSRRGGSERESVTYADFMRVLVLGTLVTLQRMRESDWSKVLGWPGV